MNSIASLSFIIGLMIAVHLMLCQQQVPTSGDGESMLRLPRIIPKADAFPMNAFISNTKVVHQASYNKAAMMSTSSVADDATHINENSSDNSDNISFSYTTAVLKVSYDGTHFSGWTGGNAGDKPNQSKAKQTNNNNKSTQQSQKQRQSRRSRTLQRKGGGWYDSNNKVRTVDHTIRMALAKIYGNVDPKNIIFEACSRTDAGVHATSLVAQFYCYNDQVINMSVNSTRYDDSSNSTFPIRPNGPTDATSFVQLPFNSDLSKLVYVLNRMLPPDVRILAASPTPIVNMTSLPMSKYSVNAFHPTLFTQSKTYVYRFSIGSIQDPLQSRFVWHLDGSSGRAMGMNGNKFDLNHAMKAAKMFVSANARDYAAFGSVMRGNEKNRVRSTICTITRCDLMRENSEQLPSWEQGKSSEGVDNNGSKRYGSRLNMDGAPIHPFGVKKGPQTFTVAITGDRFMYKMVRNIVGTIVAVACGHNELEDIQQALAARRWGNGPSGSRRICAPARGLKLVEVSYPDEIHFDWQSG